MCLYVSQCDYMGEGAGQSVSVNVYGWVRCQCVLQCSCVCPLCIWPDVCEKNQLLLALDGGGGRVVTPSTLKLQ